MTTLTFQRRPMALCSHTFTGLISAVAVALWVDVLTDVTTLSGLRSSFMSR